MSIDNCFKIRNLNCQYEKGKTVLKIDSLDIPKGKLIFFLGLSGIGKSTLLETLGLMNTTIQVDDSSQETEVSFHATDEIIELHKAIKGDDLSLSSIREKYYSFIFQQANLMPNFSAGENMCISKMLDGVHSFEETKKEVKELMKQLGLPNGVFDANITNLSGGQRQRLTFVRAFISPFEVLFGDEPTGNLDIEVASKLLSLVKRAILMENKTGIIVSHNINLAITHGDEIVLLTPSYYFEGKEEKMYGEIKEENILRKKGSSWINNEKTMTEEDVRKFIESRFKLNNK